LFKIVAVAPFESELMVMDDGASHREGREA
jgi:hypothetical protein